MYSNEVGPHPEYIALQNDLNALGYPSQAGIRNIAMINGALNGRAQATPNPGDKMFEVIYFYVVANVSANVWSNQVNQSTKVFEGFSWILLPFPSLPPYERTSVTIPRNLDRVSGGNISFDVGKISTNFSFANTFSTIDYRGALNNDGDYNVQVFDIFNPNSVVALTDANFRVKPDKQNLTPFSAIYGDYFGNTDHAVPRSVQNGWNELAVREGYGITNANTVIAGCTPPLPSPITGIRFAPPPACLGVVPPEACPPNGIYLPIPFPTNACGSGTLLFGVSNIPQIPGTYNEFFRITGNNVNRIIQGFKGGMNLSTYPNGTYTITAVRQYNGSNSVESSVSRTLTIRGNCRISSDCPSDISREGDVVLWLNDTNEPCFITFRNGILFASTENTSFVSRSRLILNGLSVTEANCYAETDPRGGTQVCQCGFSLLSASQNAGQYTGQYSFNSCNASSHKWQLLSGTTEIANSGTNPYQVTSATVPIAIPTSVNSGAYTLKVDATNCTGTSNLPFNYTKPSGSSLSLSQSSWSPSSLSSSQSINITANVVWSVSSSDDSWLTVSPSSGSNNGSFTISTTANGSSGTRTGTITVSGSGVSSQTVSVTQSGNTGSDPDRTENGTAFDGADNPPNEGEYQIFDNITNTKWLVFSPTGNVGYDFANEDAYAINKYTVASANDEPSRDPKNWNLQGSNDGSNWTTVDSRNNENFGNRFETKTYNISNTTAYKQYRLNVTANNGNGLLQIAEIQLFGPAGTAGGGTGTGGGTDPDRTESGTALDDGANNPANEGEYQAFDNTTNTKWLVFSPTGNIGYDFANEDAYAINKYTVASANDEPSRDPKNWNLQGSNDGSNWATVDTRNNENFGNRFETKTYNISNTTAYKQYRLNVTANNGNGLLQIAEIQLFGPSGTGGGGGSCNYSDGQFLFNFYGEVIIAKFCNGILYARADGGAFKPRSWLIGAGMNPTAAACFTENNPGCGVSSTRVSNNNLVFEEEKMEVYPNPSNGKIKVGFSLQQAESVWLQLIDSQGRSLQLRDFEGKIGRNLVDLDLQNYPTGTYFINLQSSQKREVQKVVKVE